MARTVKSIIKKNAYPENKWGVHMLMLELGIHPDNVWNHEGHIWCATDVSGKLHTIVWEV